METQIFTGAVRLLVIESLAHLSPFSGPQLGRPLPHVHTESLSFLEACPPASWGLLTLPPDLAPLLRHQAPGRMRGPALTSPHLGMRGQTLMDKHRHVMTKERCHS